MSIAGGFKINTSGLIVFGAGHGTELGDGSKIAKKIAFLEEIWGGSASIPWPALKTMRPKSGLRVDSEKLRRTSGNR